MFLSEREPAFLRAFLNNVSIECSRVTMAAANRQKGDFISSISHVSAIIPQDDGELLVQFVNISRLPFLL
jgi:hypothetical protein